MRLRLVQKIRLNRLIKVVLITAMLCSLFSGCYDKREVDDLTYAIAIGIDRGVANDLRLTIQYAIPLAIGGGGGGGGGEGGGGGGGSKSLGLVSVDAPSIYSALNIANNFIGKQLNLSHAKVAVFSEEMAKSGKMHDFLHAMIRGREFRPNMYIAVSRGTAEDYLKSVKPLQEADPAKYYELKFATYSYTGFTANTQLSRFYSQAEALGVQPVATLVGVSKYESVKDIDPSNTTAREKGRDKPLMGDYMAGEIPKAGDIKGETMGLAVFDGTLLTGEMDGEETLMYLIASGQYDSSYVTFPDPEDKSSYVVLNVKQSRRPQYSVVMDNGKPKINLKIKLEGDYLSIQSGIDYETGAKLEEFQTSAQQFLKGEMLRFLNRTAKEFHSDICGFGRHIKGKFLTWDEWQNFNWLGRYKDASFDVDVDLKVRRTGLMIRSMPGSSSKGTEE